MIGNIWDKDLAVLEAVRAHGSPTGLEIVHATADDYTAHTIKATTKALVRQGYLRMKDNDTDHEWEYRLNEKGRQAIAKARGTQ